MKVLLLHLADSRCSPIMIDDAPLAVPNGRRRKTTKKSNGSSGLGVDLDAGRHTGEAHVIQLKINSTQNPTPHPHTTC
jgi:hypothetical protein